MKPQNTRIGFTTMTFKNSLLKSEITLPELLTWAADAGFGWAEVRDFEASLSGEETRSMLELAGNLSLRLHYAWDGLPVTDLSGNQRMIKNASLLGADTFSRIVVAPSLISAAAGKFGYSSVESVSLAKSITELIHMASAAGVTLVFENSLEPLLTTGNLLGYDRLLRAVPDMRMTLDTANPFNANTIGQPATEEVLFTFVEQWADRIPYVHLKSSASNAVVPDLLANGDFSLAQLIQRIDPSALLCVELPDDGSVSSAQQRLTDGLQLVKSII